jgi:fluoroquinolone transport system permease protein
MTAAGRLRATIACDLRVQSRNGFFIASALVAVSSIVVLRWLPDDAVDLLLPIILLQNVLTNSFYFVSGMILLERGEGTLVAQLVSPLRAHEYIASKVITLLGLSLVESLLITVAAADPGAGVIPLTLGLGLASILYTLFGIICVARYQSINEFLMPSVVYTALLSLPIFGYFGIGPQWLYVAHPLQWCLDLIVGGFATISAGHLVFAVFAAAACTWPSLRWAERRLRRSVA